MGSERIAMLGFQINKCHISRCSGFGLVELMVAIVLGIILSVGVVEIYVNSKQTFNAQEGMSRLQENARYAMNRIFLSASGAGYTGCLSTKADEISQVQTSTLSDQDGIYDFTVPVAGIEAGNMDSLTFKRTLGHEGVPLAADMANAEDRVTLDDNDPRYEKIEQFDVMMLGDCEHVSIFMVTNDPQSSGGVIEHEIGIADPDGGQTNSTEWLGNIYQVNNQNVSSAMTLRMHVVTYSIGTGTEAPDVCSAVNPGYCSLFEEINNDDAEELVQGVHRLNVWYGQDTDGDTQVDVYRVATDVDDWSEVASVRVTLSFNSVERVQGSASGTVTHTKDITQVFRLRSRGV